MGLLFVALFWLVVFAAIAVILGSVAVAVVNPYLSNDRRKRKQLLTFLTPMVGIASFVGSSVIAIIIISRLLNIDVGFGDSWQAPLPNGYQLVSIDTPDRGNICKDADYRAEGVNGVQQIAVNGDSVIGLAGKQYFLLDTKMGRVTYFPSAMELQSEVGTSDIAFISNNDFYWSVREKPYIIGGVICLLFALSVLFVMWKYGLRYQRKQNK